MRTHTPLPTTFHVWWALTTLRAVGSSMLAFALVWTATGMGGGTVAVVSTLGALPQVVLLLLGGAVKDRLGPRRMLTVTMSAQLIVLGGLGIGSAFVLGPALLAVSALVRSAISAFEQPASSVYPRLLIEDDEQLSRALARITSSMQVARIAGVALGGVMVVVLSLPWMFAMEALVASCSLLVVALMRPQREVEPASAGGGSGAVGSGRADGGPGERADGTTVGSSSLEERPGRAHGMRRALRSLAGGFTAAHELHVWPLLGAVALVAGAVLPMVGVAFPSTGRVRGWQGSTTSLLEVAWVIGSLAVTLVVSWTGMMRNPRTALVAGPLLATLALGLFAIHGPIALTIVAAGLLGVGTTLFTSHVAPMLLRRVPMDSMTRFQSLLTLVQIVPPAALNSVFAVLAVGTHTWLAPGLAAVMAVAAVGAVLGSRPAPAPETR